MRRFGVAAGFICLALAAAPSAQAGLVGYSPSDRFPPHPFPCPPEKVTFADHAAEPNDLVISTDTAEGYGCGGDGAFILVERGLAPLGPDPGVPDPLDPTLEDTLAHCQFGGQRVRCTKTTSEHHLTADVFLGMGDDKATLKADGAHVWGDEGDDRIVGSPEDDDLDGGSGKDVLFGGAGDDRVFRSFTGPNGTDVFWGQEGDDSIDAVDGDRDKVSCGPGTDDVLADPIDRVDADCESVIRE